MLGAVHLLWASGSWLRSRSSSSGALQCLSVSVSDMLIKRMLQQNVRSNRLLEASSCMSVLLGPWLASGNNKTTIITKP